MIIYSQRDGRWGGIRLGYGNTTIHNFGCTITSLAQLLLLNKYNFNPAQVNDRLKQHNGFVGTNQNLIVWSAIEKAFAGIAKFEWRGYAYENSKVADAISKYGGCMVEVDGAPIGAPKHWILYIGNQKALDPWTGTEIATSKYKATGYAVIQVTKGADMSKTIMVEEKDWIRGRKAMDIAESVHKELGLDGDHIETPIDRFLSVIRGYKSQATDMRNKLAIAEQDVKNKKEQVDRLEERVLEEQRARKAEVAALSDAQKSIIKLRGEYEAQIDSLHLKYDQSKKEYGNALKSLAVLEVENAQLRKGVKTSFTLWEWVIYPLPWLLNKLKSIELGGK